MTKRISLILCILIFGSLLWGGSALAHEGIDLHCYGVATVDITLYNVPEDTEVILRLTTAHNVDMIWRHYADEDNAVVIDREIEFPPEWLDGWVQVDFIQDDGLILLTDSILCETRSQEQIDAILWEAQNPELPQNQFGAAPNPVYDYVLEGLVWRPIKSFNVTYGFINQIPIGDVWFGLEQYLERRVGCLTGSGAIVFHTVVDEQVIVKDNQMHWQFRSLQDGTCILLGAIGIASRAPAAPIYEPQNPYQLPPDSTYIQPPSEQQEAALPPAEIIAEPVVLTQTTTSPMQGYAPVGVRTFDATGQG